MHFCCLCSLRFKSRAKRSEGFRFVVAFQHPPISLDSVADDYLGIGAGEFDILNIFRHQSTFVFIACKIKKGFASTYKLYHILVMGCIFMYDCLNSF